MKLDVNTSDLSYIMNGLLTVKEHLLDCLSCGAQDKDDEYRKYFENRLVECDTTIHKVRACYKRGRKNG